MAAALLHDVGKAREFTYGAEFGLSDEGRLLGHLAIGAEIIAGAAEDVARGAPAAAAQLRALPSRRRSGRRGRASRGFGSPEALALYRLNALDASVKGALEHGLSARARLGLSARRTSWAAITSASAANSSSSVRSGTALEIDHPTATPSGESDADDQPVADPDVAVAVLPPGADAWPRRRSPAARSPRRCTWVWSRKIDERGDEEDPAAHAEQPADHPAGEPESAAATYSIRQDQLAAMATGARRTGATPRARGCAAEGRCRRRPRRWPGRRRAPLRARSTFP